MSLEEMGLMNFKPKDTLRNVRKKPVLTRIICRLEIAHG